MQSNVKISICLPNYNTRAFLEPRMESIFAQSINNWELVICDSYSNDGAWEYLCSFKDDARISLRQVPRQGVYAGWNDCIKRATGEYIYIATSDDTATPACLEKLAGILNKHDDVDLAVCRFKFINEQGREMQPPPFQEVGSFYDPWREKPHRRSGLLEFLVHVGLDCPSWTTITAVMFRRRLIDKIGLFRTDCGTCADRLWAMRAAMVTDTISIPDCLATWRKHSLQASTICPSIRMVRRNGKLSAETLEACEKWLPDEWKKESGWRERILRNVRGQYYKRIGLDRVTLRTKPREFLKGMAYATLNEPIYLTRRLASGLTWKLTDFGDEEKYLTQLIRDWSVPWPPIAV